MRGMEGLEREHRKGWWEGGGVGVKGPRNISLCLGSTDRGQVTSQPLTVSSHSYLISSLLFPSAFPSLPYPSLPFPSPGKLVLNEQTYSSGIGEFDKVAIDYGYRIFTEVDENPLLRDLIDKAELDGYCFLTDQVTTVIVFSTVLFSR